jgi:hypothetical protein
MFQYFKKISNSKRSLKQNKEKQFWKKREKPYFPLSLVGQQPNSLPLFPVSLQPKTAQSANHFSPTNPAGG